MIFPIIKTDNIVQINDKFRINANNSFVNQGEITSVKIRPEIGQDFFEVFNPDDISNKNNNYYLDWAYETQGDKSITLEVTTTIGIKSKDFGIQVLTEEDDALFSNDNNLISEEPNIFKFLPPGKSSFIYAHREAQNQILSWLDEQRIWNIDGTRITKFQILDKKEFQEWSKYLTLMIIFQGSQISVGDYFQEKLEDYDTKMQRARNRGALRLDLDMNGKNDTLPHDLRTTRMVLK